MRRRVRGSGDSGGLCNGVGLELYESFEEGVLPSGWTTGGDAPWVVVTEEARIGTYSAASGAIAPNQESWLRWIDGVHVTGADGAACDDGEPCTTATVCASGACVGDAAEVWGSNGALAPDPRPAAVKIVPPPHDG